MLDNNKGFELWADGYDKSVGVSDEENTYPFAGYKDVLGTIYKPLWRKRTLLFWTSALAPVHLQLYYNDVLLCYGISAEDLKQSYTSKFEKNMKRW